MHVLFLLAFVLIFPFQASAAPCAGNAATTLEMVKWSATKNRQMIPGVRIAMTTINRSPHHIRVLDATVHFQDLLGSTIANVNYARDVSIEPGAQHGFTGTFSSILNNISRLLKIRGQDVRATICVRGFVDETGTVHKLSGAG